MEHNITLYQELKQNSISDYEDFSDQPRLKPFRVKKNIRSEIKYSEFYICRQAAKLVCEHQVCLKWNFQRITQKVGAQEAPFMSYHPILYIGIGIGRHSGAFIF